MSYNYETCVLENSTPKPDWQNQENFSNSLDYDHDYDDIDDDNDDDDDVGDDDDDYYHWVKW